MENNLNEKEVLTKTIFVQSDDNYNMSLVINLYFNNIIIDENEYFKVYNNINPNKATKVARIKFRKPEYIIYDNNKINNWFLNSIEKRALMRILINQSILYPDRTVWDELIRLFNKEMGSNSLPNDLKIPNYNYLY